MLDRQLIFVSGKGGVGKSAVAAALAILAARRGQRVLALAMVDAIGLAAHFRVDTLSYQPHEVRPGVSVAVIDRARALDEYLKLQMHMPAVAPTRQFSRALNVLVDTAPGVREIVSIGKPIYELWRGEWDLIVADAPPLGQLGSYLRAPATITDLVPAGAVQEQAGRMRSTLADPQTSGLVLVAVPEELPVLEVEEALEDLDAEPVIDLASVASNRVLPEFPFAGSAIATLSNGAHIDSVRLHLGLCREQERWLQRLPEGPRLPFLFGLLTPGEVAARLADTWEEHL